MRSWQWSKAWKRRPCRHRANTTSPCSQWGARRWPFSPRTPQVVFLCLSATWALGLCCELYIQLQAFSLVNDTRENAKSNFCRLGGENFSHSAFILFILVFFFWKTLFSRTFACLCCFVLCAEIVHIFTQMMYKIAFLCVRLWEAKGVFIVSNLCIRFGVFSPLKVSQLLGCLLWFNFPTWLQFNTEQMGINANHSRFCCWFRFALLWSGSFSLCGCWWAGVSLCFVQAVC